MSEHHHDPESLADRLDNMLPPGHDTTPNGHEDPLLDAAIRLAAAPPPQLSADAFSRIQAQLEVGSSLQAPSTASSSRIIQWQPLLKWAVAASIALVIMTGGVAGASLGTIPGDILYPVKQVVEDVELVLATSQQGKATTRLIHAERRVNEALELLEQGRFEATLFDQSLAEMTTAAAIARSAALPVDDVRRLEQRTTYINILLDDVVRQADDAGFVPVTTLDAVVLSLDMARSSGQMLFVPTPTPPPPTPMVAPTATHTPTATFTATHTPTPTHTATPTATELPVDFFVQGPVDAIEGNIVTIFETEIMLDPDDPRLLVIEVGDIISVTGTDIGGSIEADDFEFPEDEVFVSEDGQVYRDDGGCANPPPPWAPAHGWRARCQNAPRPGGGNGAGNANGNAQGNSNGNAQGNANGNSNGRGNN